MRSVILLLSSLALAVGRPIVSIDVDHFDSPPLKNLPEAARKEFNNILSNQTLSIGQIVTEVSAWGVKNGVQESVNAEITKDEQRTKDMRVNVTRALAELPAYISKVNAIEDNKSLTFTQIYEQAYALYESIKIPYVAELLEAVAYPEFEEGEYRGFSIKITGKRPRASIDVEDFDFPPLKRVSEQARKDFASILKNEALSIGQMEEQVRAWATKNGVLDAVNAEIAKDEQRTKDMRVNVTRALAELPAYIAKVNAIEDNKSLTLVQIYEQTYALYESIKIPYVAELLEAVAYPEFEEGDYRGFSINIASKRPRASIDAANFDFPPLKNLPKQARKEFRSILLNKTLSISQIEAEVRAWGVKHGVADAVNAEIAKDEQITKDMRVNVTRALAELPAYISKVNAIEDNKSLTLTQIYEQTYAVYESIRIPYVAKLLEAVAYPEFAKGEKPGFSIKVRN